MRLWPRFHLATALVLALAAASPAAAASFGFGCITHDRAADCAIGEAQLSVDVTDPGSGKIDFTFRNVGPGASSITDIYWDDDVLLEIFSITNSPGVKFSKGANPGNLPGANNVTPKFQVSKGLAIDSDSPVQPNGVNPGEMLLVRMKLLSGQTFADALADLADGSLRIGLHVQGLGKEKCGSESFVNTRPTPPIPEPGTFVLVAGGLLMLAGARRAMR